MPLKRWIWPGETKQADELAAAGIQPLTARVLASRGIGSPNEARRFLSTEGELHDPFLMKGMEQAVALIEGALQEGKLIVIYGDYDCDGITSTVLLYRYLEEQGANVGYYIPDREEEGYGLNMEACETLHQNGAELVITVDNGISAAAEIDRLHELGIKVVVTDHHQPPEILPAADALIDPHCEDSGYPFRELCGVGVAFKLVCALEGDIEGVDTLARYADLAAIGTIADVVPLCGENRIIARAGLQKMEESENPGICALLAAAGLAEKALGAESVSFGLAPRLNAASRMGNCDDSVALMLCDDPQQAAVLAERVDAANRERKQLEGAIMADIARQVEEDPSLLRYRVLVLAGEGWHHGIVGIAASRMVERYGKPCLLIGTQGEEARGSARSVPGFSVIDAITRCKDCLIKFGGHPLAAGFSLKTSDVGRLRAALERAAAGMAPDMPIPQLPLDAALHPRELDIATIEQLSALEPFGAGNELPLFLLPGARIEEINAIGEGKHLKLRLRFGERSHYAVYFGMTVGRFPYRVGEAVDVAANLSVSEYLGQKRLSIKIRDLRPQGFDQEEYFADYCCCERLSRGEELTPEQAGRITPVREELALVYRAVQKRSGLPADGDQFYLSCCRGRLGCGKTRVALDVLLEAGLIASRDGQLQILPAEGKKDLMSTKILSRLHSVLSGNAVGIQ